ncbi:MAG: hemerythrin family protein [Deltaproteobacteria bacterium]|nr:hemerythrin family protein [Deltaproteobacteria bacterium]
MSIEWSEKFESGLDWQDRQHRELLKRINAFLDAMDHGPRAEEPARLLNFLWEYSVIHFDAEEQGMKKYKFPGAGVHIREHADFMEDISRLKSDLKVSASTAPVADFQRRISDWFARHIGGTDKEFARFIFEAGQGREGDG